MTAPGRRKTPSCDLDVDATEVSDTTEPAGDKAEISGDADEAKTIMLSVSRIAGDAELASVANKVDDDGEPNDDDFVDEFVDEPETKT